jgi:hypothetical protein
MSFAVSHLIDLSDCLCHLIIVIDERQGYLVKLDIRKLAEQTVAQ